MLYIKVLGNGCTKCTSTAALITTIATNRGISINLIMESNPEVMMDYRVVSSPAVVINERLMHWGSTPQPYMVESWLNILR
ncbi:MULTISPECIES: thioredoxin family protein [Shewanella]|uniref:Thioredoxin family protein n=1 Tax=Shewanella oncorhynchi TaxID=2726434 RepID=A0ABX1KJV9_9GAMM|nr:MULTISPECIES: thioredoxin family protein [Shewanella]NLQ22480.1 thioredoxin family protein [Shewanella oncorhynchi]